MSLLKRNPRRSFAAVLATGVLAAGGVVLVAATPAAAAAGCPYPYVCFYPTYAEYAAGRPVSRYRDVTAGWQYLRSQSVGADYIANTRNDDVAYLHFTDGSQACVLPRSTHNWNEKQVDRVRIDSSSTC